MSTEAFEPDGIRINLGRKTRAKLDAIEQLTGAKRTTSAAKAIDLYYEAICQHHMLPATFEREFFDFLRQRSGIRGTKEHVEAHNIHREPEGQ